MGVAGRDPVLGTGSRREAVRGIEHLEARIARYRAHFRVDVREAAEIARLVKLGQEDQRRRGAVRAEERAEFVERGLQALPARPAVAVERPVVVAVVAQPRLRALAEAGREQADERRA